MPGYPGIDATTRAELSGFLKSRRARIAPATVGLNNGHRRRTPGLRREEVADLAEQPSLRLYLYRPGDGRTESKLRETVASRPALTP
jgi:hypothetical protein